MLSQSIVSAKSKYEIVIFRRHISHRPSTEDWRRYYRKKVHGERTKCNLKARYKFIVTNNDNGKFSGTERSTGCRMDRT